MEFKEFLQLNEAPKVAHYGNDSTGTGEVKAKDKIADPNIEKNKNLLDHVNKLLKDYMDKIFKSPKVKDSTKEVMRTLGLDSSKGIEGLSHMYNTVLNHILYDTDGNRIDLGSESAVNKAKPELQKMPDIYGNVFNLVKELNNGGTPNKYIAPILKSLRKVISAGNTPEAYKDVDIVSQFSDPMSSMSNEDLQGMFKDIQARYSKGESPKFGDLLGIPNNLFQSIVAPNSPSVARDEFNNRNIATLRKKLADIRKGSNTMDKAGKDKKMKESDELILNFAHKLFGSSESDIDKLKSDPKKYAKARKDIEDLLVLAKNYVGERGIFTNIYQQGENLGKYGNIASIGYDILGDKDMRNFLKTNNIKEIYKDTSKSANANTKALDALVGAGGEGDKGKLTDADINRFKEELPKVPSGRSKQLKDLVGSLSGKVATDAQAKELISILTKVANSPDRPKGLNPGPWTPKILGQLKIESASYDEFLNLFESRMSK